MLTLLFSPSRSFSQISGYKVIGIIEIGGEGGWDYLSVDAAMHRLYVSHSTKVHVIDLEKNVVIGEIPNQHGVHGIAPVSEVGKGYISNGRDSSVSVFDLKTFKQILTIKIPGKNPDAIIYEPFTKRVFVFNNGSSSATAIDVKTDKIVGTIKLDGAPEFAVSDLKGKMYVNLEDISAINTFDPKTLKVISKSSIAPVSEPSGLALDREHKRLFSVGRTKMMAVVDAEKGKVIATPAIGGGVDGCAFDNGTHRIFSSNGEGSITVIQEVSPTEFKVLETVPTAKGARTIIIDETTHHVYTIAAIEKTDKSKMFSVLILDRN
jgi:DNA-binding beta-propeller fold protein YncE